MLKIFFFINLKVSKNSMLNGNQKNRAYNISSDGQAS